MNLERVLCDEIQSEFEELKKLELGTDKYRTTVDGLTKLVDRKIELEKINIESQEKADTREFEENFKLKQMADEKKDRLIKNSVALFGIIAPIGLTVWGTLKSLKFEETGTVTTMMGRGFINKLLPKK